MDKLLFLGRQMETDAAVNAILQSIERYVSSTIPLYKDSNWTSSKCHYAARAQLRAIENAIDLKSHPDFWSLLLNNALTVLQTKPETGNNFYGFINHVLHDTAKSLGYDPMSPDFETRIQNDVVAVLPEVRIKDFFRNPEYRTVNFSQ